MQTCGKQSDTMQHLLILTGNTYKHHFAIKDKYANPMSNKIDQGETILMEKIVSGAPDVHVRDRGE